MKAYLARWSVSLSALAACSHNAGPSSLSRADTPQTPSCAPERGVAIEVLGSGGPIPDDGRASSSYLVWVDGRARLLVDVGGGSFVRFGEAGARLEDLQAIAITHMHTDHSADLPALLKGGYFADRSEPLVIAGPTGNEQFPGLSDYLNALFGTQGAYAYLGWLLDDDGKPFHLVTDDVPAESRAAVSIAVPGELQLDAIGVNHGVVPALAYRLQLRDHKLVWSGDQNGDNPAFVDFARGADVLIMHHAVPEQAERIAARLHARPSEIGNVAASAKVHTLVLSHHMQRSLRQRAQSLELISSRFDGPVVFAEDLSCIRIDE